jgi:phage terminase large subunit
MPRYEGFHIVPASKWVTLHPDKQALLRTAGGFPVNDVFIPLWERPYTTRRELVFPYGTYGSSKTHDRVLEHLVLAQQPTYFKCYYGRAVFDLAKSEFHSTIVSVIKREGWEDRFEYSEKPNGSKQIICRVTGHKFIPFGCDDEESIGKGWDDATHIMLDEVNQATFRQFGMLQSRLRKKGVPKTFTGMFNNCDVLEDHWLATEIFNTEKQLTDEQGKPIERNFIPHFSKYTDNYFIDHEEYRQQLIEQAGQDPERREAVLEGKWGVQATKHPFYKNFSQRMHVGPTEYNPRLPLHISWDENVNPYLPVGIFQLDGLNLYAIDEIAAVNPYNTLRWVCNEIYKRYGPMGHDHKAGVFIYGDATSVKDDVKTEKGANFFTVVKEYLDYFKPRLRVNKRNPNVAMRGNFINTVFERNIYGIFVTISPRCTHMIADLLHTVEAPDGTKDKAKTTVDGVRGVQRWGHFSDLFDYLMCSAFERYYNLFQAGGKKRTWATGQRVAHNRI